MPVMGPSFSFSLPLSYFAPPTLPDIEQARPPSPFPGRSALFDDADVARTFPPPSGFVPHPFPPPKRCFTPLNVVLPTVAPLGRHIPFYN